MMRLHTVFFGVVLALTTAVSDACRIELAANTLVGGSSDHVVLQNGNIGIVYNSAPGVEWRTSSDVYQSAFDAPITLATSFSAGDYGVSCARIGLDIPLPVVVFHTQEGSMWGVRMLIAHDSGGTMWPDQSESIIISEEVNPTFYSYGRDPVVRADANGVPFVVMKGGSGDIVLARGIPGANGTFTFNTYTFPIAATDAWRTSVSRVAQEVIALAWLEMPSGDPFNNLLRGATIDFNTNMVNGLFLIDNAVNTSYSFAVVAYTDAYGLFVIAGAHDTEGGEHELRRYAPIGSSETPWQDGNWTSTTLYAIPNNHWFKDIAVATSGPFNDVDVSIAFNVNVGGFTGNVFYGAHGRLNDTWHITQVDSNARDYVGMGFQKHRNPFLYYRSWSSKFHISVASEPFGFDWSLPCVVPPAPTLSPTRQPTLSPVQSGICYIDVGATIRSTMILLSWKDFRLALIYTITTGVFVKFSNFSPLEWTSPAIQLPHTQAGDGGDGLTAMNVEEDGRALIVFSTLGGLRVLFPAGDGNDLTQLEVDLLVPTGCDSGSCGRFATVKRIRSGRTVIFHVDNGDVFKVTRQTAIGNYSQWATSTFKNLQPESNPLFVDFATPFVFPSGSPPEWWYADNVPSQVLIAWSEMHKADTSVHLARLELPDGNLLEQTILMSNYAPHNETALLYRPASSCYAPKLYGGRFDEYRVAFAAAEMPSDYMYANASILHWKAFMSNSSLTRLTHEVFYDNLVHTFDVGPGVPPNMVVALQSDNYQDIFYERPYINDEEVNVYRMQVASDASPIIQMSSDAHGALIIAFTRQPAKNVFLTRASHGVNDFDSECDFVPLQPTKVPTRAPTMAPTAPTTAPTAAPQQISTSMPGDEMTGAETTQSQTPVMNVAESTTPESAFDMTPIIIGIFVCVIIFLMFLIATVIAVRMIKDRKRRKRRRANRGDAHGDTAMSPRSPRGAAGVGTVSPRGARSGARSPRSRAKSRRQSQHYAAVTMPAAPLVGVYVPEGGGAPSSDGAYGDLGTVSSSKPSNAYVDGGILLKGGANNAADAYEVGALAAPEADYGKAPSLSGESSAYETAALGVSSEAGGAHYETAALGVERDEADARQRGTQFLDMPSHADDGTIASSTMSLEVRR